MRCPTLTELPPPPPGKTGWPWTEETPPLPETMPDGLPWPRISIVTPSFNQGEFLEETIRSVLLQGYPDLEYIIIDGGSTDNSVEIIKKYEQWLTYWVSEPDRGQTYAIQKGMERVSGEIANWLNSDDLLLPDALRTLALYRLEIQGDKFILCGHAYIIDKTGNIIEDKKVSASNPLEEICPTIPPLKGGIQASWFYSMGAWKEAKGLNLDLDYAMDTDLYIRFNHLGIPFYIVNHYVASYRFHQDTKTRKGWKRNVDYKIKFYKRQLLGLDPGTKKKYWKRVRRALFALCLNGIIPEDHFITRLYRVLYAFYLFPEALLAGYQIKRGIKLLFNKK